MRRYFYLNLWRTLLFFIICGYAQPVFSQDNFLGEKYAYKLTYLSIPAVNIFISVPETLLIRGQKVFHVLAVARTNSLFSPFYTLENHYDTYIHTDSGLPVQFNKDIHQRTLTQQGEISYDQEKLQAVYDGGKFVSQITTSIQKNTHNLFSMIFYLRREALHIGQQFNFNLDVESEPWNVETKVIARENIKAADSLYEAYKISFQFIPTKEELKRHHTDILTRRVATSKTRLYFWIGVAPPYPFLKVEYEMSPFSAYTTMVKD